jgi:hypothetical protein
LPVLGRDLTPTAIEASAWTPRRQMRRRNLPIWLDPFFRPSKAFFLASNILATGSIPDLSDTNARYAI